MGRLGETMRVEQDGADFYDVDECTLIERIEEPFLKRENPARPGDHWYSLEAAQEAAAIFAKRHPDAVFVAFDD